MKLTMNICLLYCMFCSFNLFAQAFGEQQTVVDGLLQPRGIHAADMDGDTDIDIIVAVRGDNQILWLENTDGNGTFSNPTIVANNLLLVNDVYAADLDGDGDNDIAGVVREGNTVIWLENVDGLGNFASPTVLATEDAPFSVKIFDLDNDGDNDILYSSFFENRVSWIENLSGLGDFSDPIALVGPTVLPTHVNVGDIDGDEDLDIITTNNAADSVTWYDNLDGEGMYSTDKVVTTNVDGPISSYAVDIDGDTDLDIVTANFGEDSLSWFENTDGLGNFGPKLFIKENFDLPYYAYPCDVDNDGDIDVVSSSPEIGNKRLVWFENTDGQGNFSDEQLISTDIDFVRYIYGADFDNDGDEDIFYSDQNNGAVYWVRNQAILDVPEFQKPFKCTISPNPVKDILTITSNKEVKRIQITDLLGQEVAVFYGQTSLDISFLPASTYFILITDEIGNSIIEKMIKY